MSSSSPAVLQPAQDPVDHVVDRQQGAQLAGADLGRLGRGHRVALAQVAGAPVQLGGAAADLVKGREAGLGVLRLGHPRVVGGERGQVQEPGAGVVALELVQVGHGLVADEGGRVGGHPSQGPVDRPQLVVVAAVGQGPVVEPGRRGAQRPAVEELAGHGRAVAVVGEVAGHGGPLVEPVAQALAEDPVVVDVAAAQDRRPRRAAAGGGREPLGEGHPAVGQPGPGLGHHLEGLGPGVVGHDHQHVRPRRPPVGPGRAGGRASRPAHRGEGQPAQGQHGHRHPGQQQAPAHHASWGARERRRRMPLSASHSSRSRKRHSRAA